MLFNFSAVAGRVGLGNTEKMSPSLQAYLTENSTVSVYADDTMVTDNVTLLDGAAVAILAGSVSYIFTARVRNTRKGNVLKRVFLFKPGGTPIPIP